MRCIVREDFSSSHHASFQCANGIRAASRAIPWGLPRFYGYIHLSKRSISGLLHISPDTACRHDFIRSLSRHFISMLRRSRSSSTVRRDQSLSMSFTTPFPIWWLWYWLLNIYWRRFWILKPAWFTTARSAMRLRDLLWRYWPLLYSNTPPCPYWFPTAYQHWKLILCVRVLYWYISDDARVIYARWYYIHYTIILVFISWFMTGRQVCIWAGKSLCADVSMAKFYMVYFISMQCTPRRRCHKMSRRTLVRFAPFNKNDVSRRFSLIVYIASLR